MAALGRKLEEERPALKAYLRRRVGNPADVDDYVQEVYLRALAAADQAEKVRSWRGFLLRIASNLVTDQWRRNQSRAAGRHVALDEAHEAHDDGLQSPERALENAQALERLQVIVDRQPPVAREAFLLARVKGLSHAEVGRQIGMTTKDASRLIERTLARVAREFGGEA